MLFLNVTFLPAFTSQNNHPGFEKTVCGKHCGNAKPRFAFCLTANMCTFYTHNLQKEDLLCTMDEK